MKIEEVKDKDKKTFKTINLRIRIEYEEELVALRLMAALDCSIPGLFSNEKNKRTIKDFLEKLHKELWKGDK